MGNRRGWRLPTIQELLSLVDPSNPTGNPDLPLGHPFNIVQQNSYWSATTFAFADNPGFAWGMNLSNGDVFAPEKDSFRHAWCVRGGQGIDGVQ